MKQRKLGQAGTVIEALLIIIILAIIAGTGWYVWHAKHNADDSLKNANANNQTTPNTPTKSTTDAALNQDLNGINSSLNQGSKDQVDAASGLNDQNSEITIPTN